MATETCGARNRQGKPCGRPAGWGTDHVGTGRCKLHGGASTGPKDRAKASAAQRGNTKSLRTGERSQRAVNRERDFKRSMKRAPVTPTEMLEDQARRTKARLDFMYELLLKTEQQLVDLAAEGDGTAVSALAILETTRKQEPRQIAGQNQPQLVDVELSTKARSLLDLWHAQQLAITRVELLYGRTADRLKPPPGREGPGGGGIGTLIINNTMPGVDDDGGDAA